MFTWKKEQLFQIRSRIQFNQKNRKVEFLYDDLTIFDEMNHIFEDKNLYEFWDLYSLPPEIKNHVIEGQKKANLQEQEFIENLDNEKDKFQGNQKNYIQQSRNLMIILKIMQNLLIKEKDFLNQKESVQDELEQLIKNFAIYQNLWTYFIEFEMEKSD